jgi:cytochrome c oxidase cbb3-type subunit 3
MLFIRRFTHLFALMPLLLCASRACVGQSQAVSRNTGPKSSEGKRSFASTCAQCHGLDGKGSERAPNIADRPAVQRLSDSQIYGIIENGVPGTGMPAFHSLQNSQLRTLVVYLRTLQGRNKTTALPGNPEQGKTMFFGKAGCFQCHMVAGEGGFIASDLSEYAHIHTVAQIRETILNPASNNRQARLVTATLHGGVKYVGRIRDEDNFSVQLQTLDGAFHFLSKSDIDELQPNPQPLMPSDYGSKLAPQEVNDIVSYLMSVGNANGPAVPAKVDDLEQ